MKILGLIVEYNPLHNGHLYHLQTAKDLIRPQATIAVMSGSFTQRGEPALVSKWARARMALAAGVDLVLELPTAWATQSAYHFAGGALRLLATAGATDFCFGSESGRLDALGHIAEILLEEPPPYREALKAALSRGHSFATAQGLALTASLGNEESQFFSKPNNTLGVHYLLALKKHGLPIRAHTVTRRGAYHSRDSTASLPSAAAIRRLVEAGQAPQGMPASAESILKEELAEGRGPVNWPRLAPNLFYKLRNLSKNNMDHWPESGEGLGDRLWHAARKTNDWDEFLSLAKTRRFPLTRIQRLATYLLLNITRSRLERTNLHLPPPYLRVLALNTTSTAVRKLLGTSEQPVVFSVAKAPFTQLRLKESLLLDISATDIHTLAWSKHGASGLDYTLPLVTR